jgi:DNA repair and recombination protein RAD52
MEQAFEPVEIKELEKKLDPKNVSKRKQSGFELSYIEGWHAIAEANRIFGFDAWTRETVDLIENHPPFQNQNNKHVVSFRARVKVTIKGVIREGTGHGSGISANLNDAYEGAIKEAETDAMKRALMTFGNPFGLALYDKKQVNVGVDKPKKENLPGDEYAQLLKDIKESETHAGLNSAREAVQKASKTYKFLPKQLEELDKAKKAKMNELTPPNGIQPDQLNQPIESTVQ